MMPREPFPYQVLAGLALVVVCAAVALWAVVWNLRAAGNPTAAERVVQRRIARKAMTPLPPAEPPAKPVFEDSGPPPGMFPVGVQQYTPVWLADDTVERRNLRAHRLVSHGYRTPEGYLIRQGEQRFGRTMPAGLAIANRNVQFCRRCWPAVPVIPGRPLPRRRPTS